MFKKYNWWKNTFEFFLTTDVIDHIIIYTNREIDKMRPNYDW